MAAHRHRTRPWGSGLPWTGQRPTPKQATAEQNLVTGRHLPIRRPAWPPLAWLASADEALAGALRHV
jgi:hypothetical protein